MLYSSRAGDPLELNCAGGYREKTTGANRNDSKQVTDAEREAGVPREELSEAIHKIKNATNRGNSNNFTYKQLLEIARDLKRGGGR